MSSTGPLPRHEVTPITCHRYGMPGHNRSSCENLEQRAKAWCEAAPEGNKRSESAGTEEIAEGEEPRWRLQRRAGPGPAAHEGARRRAAAAVAAAAAGGVGPKVIMMSAVDSLEEAGALR